MYNSHCISRIFHNLWHPKRRYISLPQRVVPEDKYTARAWHYGNRTLSICKKSMRMIRPNIIPKIMNSTYPNVSYYSVDIPISPPSVSTWHSCIACPKWGRWLCPLNDTFVIFVPKYRPHPPEVSRYKPRFSIRSLSCGVHPIIYPFRGSHCPLLIYSNVWILRILY